MHTSLILFADFGDWSCDEHYFFECCLDGWMIRIWKIGFGFGVILCNFELFKRELSFERLDQATIIL